MKLRKNFYGRRISDDTRRNQNRGEGFGADYRPWIRVQEQTSGTATGSVIVDPYTGRSVHLLNTVQAMAWLILRYDQNVTDIREQFPLDIEATQAICRRYGLTHPGRNSPDGHIDRVMVSDFLVDFSDGSKKVYSAENSSHYLENSTRKKNMFIEKTYWMEQDIPFIIITKEDINKSRTFCTNIQMAFSVSRPDQVHDIYSYIEYMITHHKIMTDMQSRIISLSELAQLPEIIHGYSEWLNHGRTQDIIMERAGIQEKQ